jgi:hypothetical protein
MRASLRGARGSVLGYGKDIFSLANPSSRIMALGFDSACIRSEYQELSWGVKGGRRVSLITLPPSVSQMSRENVGAPTSHNPMGLHGLLQG